MHSIVLNQDSYQQIVNALESHGELTGIDGILFVTKMGGTIPAPERLAGHRGFIGYSATLKALNPGSECNRL